MIHGEWCCKMNEQDKKTLEQIGGVNLDRISNMTDKEAEREDDIKSAIEFLTEFTDAWGGDTLNQWEEEFIDSLGDFIARGYRLTDKQFEKLLQIKVKYE